MTDFASVAEAMDWSDVGSIEDDVRLLQSSSLSLFATIDRKRESLIRRAKSAFVSGDTLHCLAHVRSGFHWDFLEKNANQLQQCGLFEDCLLKVHTCTFNDWTKDQSQLIRRLFSIANRDRLRAAGQSFPGDGPFTLYRAVCGDEGDDGAVGWSWTDRLQFAEGYAKSFAVVFARWYGRSPVLGILQATVPAGEVLAYVGGVNNEFIAQPSAFQRITIARR